MADLNVVAGDIILMTQSCTHMKEDVIKFEQWATIFAQPTVLTEHVSKNMMLHYKDIAGNLSTAKTDLDNGDLFSFGEHFGDAVFIAV